MAEAIRVYTMQKQLGKDAELSAAEIVRRAERCIGLAIRKGQAQGKIAKPGDIGGRRKLGAADSSICRVADVTGMRSDELSRGSYAMTDGVHPEAFEAALGEAKAERNLSRAIRRCGELLGEIEAAKNQHDAKARARGGAPPSRGAAARAAGLSRDQRRNALRVASIPKADFEAAVELRAGQRPTGQGAPR